MYGIFILCFHTIRGYSEVDKVYEIRDPIHGFIEIDSWERVIIDHPVFQRLRRIRQLAWTDMVYPGAMHTRFEHSLGVMHVATKMYDHIRKKKSDYLKKEMGFNDSGLDRDRKLVRLACLLHDVGHSPFSHAGEGLMDINTDINKPYKHEDYSAAIVLYKFKDAIEKHPQNENYHFTAKEISDFLSGSIDLGRRLLWRNLVSGQLDADRADYLLRDSYHIGVNYGSYDLNRLLVTLTVSKHPETGAPLIAIEEGGLHAAEALIIARYLMFTQVYFHHTRRAYDYHIAEAMKIFLQEETPKNTFPPPTSEKNIDSYLSWDDWRVLGLLREGKGGKPGEILRNREHYRCVYHTPEVPDEDDLDKAKTVLEKLSGIEGFVDEAKKSWYSIGEEDIMIEKYSDNQVEIVPLSTLSSVVKGLLPVRQRRIYVPKADKEKAELIVSQCMGRS